MQGQTFVYHNHERRPPPRIKTTQTVSNCATIARDRGIEHFLGQKGFPMLYNLTGYNYEKFNLLEWMHNLARAFDNFNNLLVGVDAAFDRKSRTTSSALGLFPEISLPVYLSRARTRVLAGLTDVVIGRGDNAWCRRWLKICGVQMERDVGVRVLRTRLIGLRDAAQRGDRLLLPGVHPPLPWRLSDEAQGVVNKRVCDISYPHYTPTCSVGDYSFIKKGGCWRTAEKIQALCVILIPVLRGYVRAFRTGLRSLVHGLRLLMDQASTFCRTREDTRCRTWMSSVTKRRHTSCQTINPGRVIHD